MKRRSILKTIPALAVPLTGCGSDDDGDPDDESEGNGDGDDTATESPTETPPIIEEYLVINSHEWIGQTLELSIENMSDETLGFVQINADIYNGDTRIAHYYSNVGELPPETKQNTSIDFGFAEIDGSICDATRYDIVPSVTMGTDDYEHRYTYDDTNFCE